MTEKDTRIAEAEYLLSNYFYSHLDKVMNSVKSQLQHDQAKEQADYALSFHGIMSSLAAASNPAGSLVDNSQTFLRVTGEHNSKTAEDYVEMCKSAIAHNWDFQSDLGRLAGEWRNAVIAKVGREKYNAVSEKLGGDLAFAYVDSRIEQMMIDKMVRDQMPKSSFDYIARKGAATSLLGLSQTVLQSPLEAEIEARGEAAYRPSGKERLGARAVGFGADVVAFGGVSSWSSLLKLAGWEVVFAGVDTYLEKNAKKPKTITIDQIVSKAVFGSDKDVMGAYRMEGLKIKAYESEYIQGVNNSMTKRMLSIPTEKPFLETWNEKPFSYKPFDFTAAISGKATAATNPLLQPRDKNVPLVIAPGQEDAYLAWKDAKDFKKSGNNANIPLVIAPGKEQEYLDWKAEHEFQKANPNPDNEWNDEVATDQQLSEEMSNPQIAAADGQNQQGTSPQTNQQENHQTNENGWAGLLSSTGLSGLGDIGNNLGFVLSMLPELLLGVFTGDTKSLNCHNSMMPLASILLGVFIRNPILKMMLIGFGGANLLNKVGHEALDRQNERLGIPQKAQFKQYEDEQLNPRIVNPAISGNSLIATIDHVPCTVTLPDNVVNAYNTGSLPLNPLANAILARHDRMQQLTEENYRNNQLSQDRIIIQR